ncbi:hypothetical protein BDR04DRAFT_1114419 [Suillus decipiens]|nr:hypothetical protein BDR04DRAFT_1114419 [Suillus decipiens]
MPVAHVTLKLCMCKECIGKGGYDKNGTPKGVLMAKCSIASHILHVKVECSSGIVDIDSVATDLSTCTIADYTSSVPTIADDLSCLTLSTNTLPSSSMINILAAQFGNYKSCNDGPIEINTVDTLPRAPVNNLDKITQIVLFLGVTCRVILGVGRSSCDLIMKIISIILFLTLWRLDNSLSPSHTDILNQIPVTSESAEARFHLKAKTVPYTICSCHCTYTLTYAVGSMTPVYPEWCTHRPTPMTECGEALLVGADEARQHGKTFMYHDFRDYLSGLLTHRDIEAMMDQACNDLMDSINSPHLSFVKNPFEAQFLHQFSGPQAGSLFIDRGEEGCYAFALHMDFFNLEGLNIHGASTSCRIISMLENMYLMGIIPGPKQPSLENLNHYIQPLMNDLVDAWQHGIKYSKTTCYPDGWLTHSTIALIVCDLPAACHIASMAGVSSHFYCSLPVEELTSRSGNLMTEKNYENMWSTFMCNFSEVPPGTMTAKEVTQKVGRTLKIDYVKALLNWRHEQPFTAPQNVADCAVTSMVPDDLYALIRQQMAVLHATLKFNSVVYSKASTHLGNSQIFFYPQGDWLLTPVPASIKYIYNHHHTRIMDPFAMYRSFPAKLYLTDLESHLENVKVSWVVGERVKGGQ